MEKLYRRSPWCCQDVSRRRSGYSLLEILIATTVLALGLLAIFGLTQTAHQRSLDSSDLAAVELALQSTLNELLAQQKPIEPLTFRPIEGVRHWMLEVKLFESPRPGLATIFLNAQKFSPQGDGPDGPSFQLVRWIPKHRVNIAESTFEGSPDVFDSGSEFVDPF